MKATVLGASGFIGRHLVRHLRKLKYTVATPDRKALKSLSGDLGDTFYCIGLTGNFRARPLSTVDAHSGILADLLERCDFRSFIYFSSTRIYANAATPQETQEDALIKVRPSADTTYDLSKMLGEALCLSLDHPSVKVLRLSNVYGPDQSKATFLGSLIGDLSTTGTACILEAPDSSKDYISIEDVVCLTEKIAQNGRHRIYNLASGRPILHEEIAKTARALGLACTFKPGGNWRSFPGINITRLQNEFGFMPKSLLEDLPSLLHAASSPTA